VVDSAPSTPGVPGPVCHAITSLVRDAGLAVTGTVAPSPHSDPAAGLPVGLIPQDAIALLIVHPCLDRDGTQGGDESTAALERPAALTLSLRQIGMRVLAVGVGASEIALAECVVQGAENAFGLDELSSQLTSALVPSDCDAPDHQGPNNERLGRLLLLTRSERRVLYHLTTGATAIEIAEKLVLSLATVRSHIRSILRKLEVSSQLAAVAIAQGHSARSTDPEHERGNRVSSQAAAPAPER
jgi:DNA-binding CsgD family transcriptional regulator